MREPRRFRKRHPVEAMRWTGHNLDAFYQWLGEGVVPPWLNDDRDDDALYIVGREDKLGEVPTGWWVVLTPSTGAVTACGPAKFDAGYAPADTPQQLGDQPDGNDSHH